MSSTPDRTPRPIKTSRDVSKEKYLEDGSPTKCVECERPLKLFSGVIRDGDNFKTVYLKRCPLIYTFQNPEEHSYYKWYE